MNKEERRYRILYVPVQTIIGVLHGEIALVDFDLPDDARAVDFSYSFERDALGLIIRSAEFEPVTYGAEIPPLYAMGIATKRLTDV